MTSRTEWALRVRQSLGGGLRALGNGRMAWPLPAAARSQQGAVVSAITALCTLRRWWALTLDSNRWFGEQVFFTRILLPGKSSVLPDWLTGQCRPADLW